MKNELKALREKNTREGLTSAEVRILKRLEAEKTVWKKWECGAGARWTSAHPDFGYVAGETCSFSGCDCGTKIKLVGTTESRDEAADWFRRPEKKKTLRQCKAESAQAAKDFEADKITEAQFHAVLEREEDALILKINGTQKGK